MARAAHAVVILVDGALAAYLPRTAKQLTAFVPEAEPDRTRVLRAIAERLLRIGSLSDRRGLLLGEIDGKPAHEHALAEHLKQVGFHWSSQGFYLPRSARASVLPLTAAVSVDEAELAEDEDEAQDA